MNGKLILGATLVLALSACSARDEGNGSTVISVDREAVNNGLGEAGEALQDAGNEVKEAADKAVPVLENAADRTGEAVSNAADRTGAAAERAGERADNAVDNSRVTVTTNSSEEKR
jgi:F0F1-type ATP synthase membrane subunit b/b'